MRTSSSSRRPTRRAVRPAPTTPSCATVATSSVTSSAERCGSSSDSTSSSSGPGTRSPFRRRRPTEAATRGFTGRVLQNPLAATGAEKSVRHVALVTGLKHYLGPFEAYAKAQPDTPFSEEQPRLPYENFYYIQEDVLFAAAERDGFAWSVHRPHTLIGWALGNAMNMGVTLAVFGAICRETGRPFRFPGSREQWEAVTDVTDAGLLAEQLVWAATTPAAANQALNIVNGDVFRWRRMWPRLAAALGGEPVAVSGGPAPLEQPRTGAA